MIKMEPDSLSFLTIITALQSHSAFCVGFPDSWFKANPDRHTTPIGSLSTSFLTQQVWIQNTRPTASWCSYPDWDRVLNDYKQHDRVRLMVWLGFKLASSPYHYTIAWFNLPVTILCNNLFQKETWSLPPVGKTVIVHKWCIWVCIISYLWTQIIILRGYTFLTSLP